MHVRTRLRKDGTPAKVNAWHAWLMSTYWDMAQVWEQGRDAFAIGYPTDEADYAAEHPPPQLKHHMIRCAREWRREA